MSSTANPIITSAMIEQNNRCLLKLPPHSFNPLPQAR